MKQTRNTCILFVLAFIIAAAGELWPCRAADYARGHLYVIGTGPAGPKTATLQALDTIKRMDVIAAPRKQAKLFAEYVGDKPVLFDPWEGLFFYKGKTFNQLSPEEIAPFQVERFRIRDKNVERIEGFLNRGKDVGLFDSGNPCLYGPSHMYVEQFDVQDVVIIPGMGCDAAAMAALGKSTISAHDTRFVLQTSPFSLMGWDSEQSQILQDLAKYPSTMVFYMALWEPEKFFAALNRVYPSDMPCAVVYWAGYPDRERILRGTLADMGGKLKNEKENFMGLLVVGRFLEGKPYEAAIRGFHKKRK